jgi:hypothetical protein
MGVQTYRLWSRRPRDGQLSLGLSCDQEGLCLASYWRLVTAALDREGRRFYRAQPVGEINTALSAGYGVAVSAAPLYPAITRIADYMTRGEWTLATLAAVHLGLPELPDQAAAHRLLKVTTTAWDPAKHPRWPAQSTEGHGGQFRPADDGSDGSLLVPVASRTSSQVSGGGRANLKPGRYRVDLEALIEAIANARPEDVPALRRAIDEKFLRVGDFDGATKLQGMLTQASELPPDSRQRQNILDLMSAYARGNPEEVARFKMRLFELGGAIIRGATDVPVIAPPILPPDAPTDSKTLYDLGRGISDALRSARDRGDAEAFAQIAEAAGKETYLSREYPRIIADLDPPKSYEELKAAVTDESRLGYEDHHIVGQGKYNSDVDKSLIEGEGNIVRIPMYKHFEINAYYQQPNEMTGGIPPRDFYANKPFAEQLEFGKYVLRLFGVMK